MNFQHKQLLEPLKIFVVNPLSPASRLLIVKMLSGAIFSDDQFIDLNLVVYSTEMKSAETFKLELESCAFSCTNSIEVSSDLPSVTDGDIFCFMTDFANPNCIKFDKEDNDDQFNALYLIIKLANTFTWPDDAELKEIETKTVHFKKKNIKHAIPKNERKPIFLADGLVAIDILKSLSHNMPPDILFCPTPITTIAKSVLGDYLNVHCNVINDVLVWAGNDDVFHVEVEKPLIIYDELDVDSSCNRDVIGKELLESLNFDATQFSASWLKKEFIEKVAASASKNPYGCIYRAVELSRTLRDIWLTRIFDVGKKVYNNMGVISDGSLGTIKASKELSTTFTLKKVYKFYKYYFLSSQSNCDLSTVAYRGLLVKLCSTSIATPTNFSNNNLNIHHARYPYVLPIVLSNGSWSVSKRFEDDIHLKQEIKRMNKEVKQQHQQLISYCKKFLQENIVNPAITYEDSSSSTNN